MADYTLHALLQAIIKNGASDLHITTGTPPQLRIDGKLVPLKLPVLTPTDTRQLCYSILTEEQKRKFEESSELDLSFGVKDLSRFRANIFVQRGAVAAAIRVVPFKIPPFDSLGLPKSVIELTTRPRGLILVTGPTGSGKTTTLASFIDRINESQHHHILTIEDPIEFLHPHKNCLVNQREVGSDTKSFKDALRYVLRQDPDIVLIGEMRDMETVEAALAIAETGHLCLGTLHTNSAVQTINRILDIFPPHQQPQVRAQLSFVLEAVISQQLVPKVGGGRILAAEIMIPNPAIRNLIREEKTHQIYSQMQVGQALTGMQTMNQCLFSLFQRRIISQETALERSTELDEMKQTMAKNGAMPNNAMQMQRR